MQKRLKAFSLIELLVSMAIIAILLGLVGFGIATARRSSRDSERRQKLADIQVGIEDYLTRKNSYPSPDKIKLNGTKIVISTGSGTVDIEIPVKGATTPGQETKSDAARYCYILNNQGYELAVKLENGEWFEQSSLVDKSAAQCKNGTSPAAFL